jgi:K+-transporting ATPase A subunit
VATVAGAVLAFSFVSVMVVYGIQRLQVVLPFNPESQVAVSPDPTQPQYMLTEQGVGYRFAAE